MARMERSHSWDECSASTFAQFLSIFNNFHAVALFRVKSLLQCVIENESQLTRRNSVISSNSSTSNSPIYLDHAATTRCDPKVVEAMLPYFTEMFGNAGSRNHQFGWQAEDGIEIAREHAAKLIGAQAKEVIFTSGSTESNNLAIKGAAEIYARAAAGQTGRGHIITAAHEHKAVLDPIRRLMREGFDATFIQPPADGVITAEMVKAALRPDTILVSIMWANNELGTINEVPQIGRLCHEKEVIFHTDATQWVGKMPTDVERDHIDLMSWAGHKMYGPKGCGALYVRRRNPRVRLEAIQDGGGHGDHDYIKEPPSMESIVRANARQSNQLDTLEAIYYDFQMPILIGVLYFIFQMPVFRAQLLHFLPSLFGEDGNFKIMGLTATSVMFAGTFFVITLVFKKLGEGLR